MKKIFAKLMLLPLLFTAMGVVSCGEDEEMKDDIVGVWRYYNVILDTTEEELIEFDSYGYWSRISKMYNEKYGSRNIARQGDEYEVLRGRVIMYSNKEVVYKHALRFDGDKMYLDKREYKRQDRK